MLILNEIVKVSSPKKDNSKTEQNDEQHQADTAATSSTRSRKSSRTRGTGNDASPSLRSGSTGSDADTTDSTVGKITAGAATTTTESTDNDSKEEYGIDNDNHDSGHNSPKNNIKATYKSITAMRTDAKRRQRSTSYNLYSKIEEFYDREEHMSVTEENISSKRNNRDLHRVM